MPRISAIMSVKNGANDLPRSVESILNQTFDDFEFIICDDGSTDSTLSVLQEYAEKDNRIKVLHNDTSMGLAFSLNKCIEDASCNILARQDADDASCLNRFEVQYPFVVNHPEYAIVGTCYYKVSATGEINKQQTMECPTARDQVKGGKFMHPSWMMRKDMIAKVGYYTVNKYTIRSQDYHLVMKVLGAGMKLYNMQDYLYYYTMDDNMIKRVRNWKRVPGTMWIFWDAYRRNKFPFWCYIYVLKPVVVHLIPWFIMKRYYSRISVGDKMIK